MAHGWQIVDRPAEFSDVRSALIGRDHIGAVLVGPAGVGKTTLARVVTASLRSPVRWVASTRSSRSIPLGVFAHIVPTSGSRDPIALIASARESLVAQENTVIGVDDAHLLDELSATMLHQIAVDGAGRILATLRSDEPVPDAVTSLWKDGYLRRLEIAPLTKEQSIALIESVMGGTLEGLSADQMWESSGGNPLFLRHLVEGSIDAGTLTEVNGVWQLRGPTAVPSGLAALLESRLLQTGEDVITALRLLALCEPLDLDVFTQLAGEEAVETAETHGLIRVVEDGPLVNARFSHPLVGDVVRSRLGKAAARRLRGRVVQALRDRKLDSAAKRIRMAQLSIDSDQAIDTRLLITAAKDAMFLSNLPLGERIAREAYQRDGGLPSAELLSRALLWQGHPVQADEILARFDPRDLDELQLLLWGIPRVSILFWSMGDTERAHDVLALLGERVRHPSLSPVVVGVNSLIAVHENKIGEGIAAAQRVLSDPRAPKQAIDFAAFAAGLAMPVAGRGREFEPYAARCRAEQKATDGMIRVMVRYCDVLALTATGDLDLADARAADYARFSSTAQFAAWAIARITLGLVATYRGRFTDVIACIEQALAALAAEEPLPWRLPARLLLVRAYAALGRVDDAERVLSDAAEHTGGFVALHEPQRTLAMAWLVAAKGLDRRAIELARAAADSARRSGQYAVEAEALHHAARFGDRTVAERLDALASLNDGTLVPLYAAHAAAVGAGDTAALDEMSVTFEAAGLLLSAADSAAQAARLHKSAGDGRGTSRSSARAQHLADLCGGATTPALTATARTLPVTGREREIGTLIAAGSSNREIADQLSLSVRTVEGHIYRACMKLGVSDREEFAALVKHSRGREQHRGDPHGPQWTR